MGRFLVVARDFGSVVGMFRVVVVFLLLAASSRSFVECKVEANPSFMIAAGVSAASEHCIVASGASVSLGSCAKAVAVGDGNDIWSFSNGQIVSTVSSKCLTLLGGDATDGGHVGLVDCDSATKSAGSQWEERHDVLMHLWCFAFHVLVVAGNRQWAVEAWH